MGLEVVRPGLALRAKQVAIAAVGDGFKIDHQFYLPSGPSAANTQPTRMSASAIQWPVRADETGYDSDYEYKDRQDGPDPSSHPRMGSISVSLTAITLLKHELLPNGHSRGSDPTSGRRSTPAR